MLREDKLHELVCIVTQPDKPSGRGGKVTHSPVKQFGLTHGIPVLQPEKISDEINLLDEFKVDVIVTCAYGQILRQNVLDYCKHGVINVHASLLPKYRGSSPIQWAVINGECVTGITIMQTALGLDEGDIILQRDCYIPEDFTARDLFDSLSQLAGLALMHALDRIAKGTATWTPQNHAEATSYPKLTKEMARIDFSKTRREIINFVRGMYSWPVAWFDHKGQVVRVYKASEEGCFCFACADGYVSFDVIQLDGGKALPARDYINGRKIRV
jgi:methionyl-tRNA formyltransferase